MTIFGKNPPQLPLKTIHEIENLKDFDVRRLYAVAGLLNALAHKIRLQIVEVLREKQIVSVTDLFTTLRLEQAVVSRHLGILKKEGLLNSKREGKQIYYFLNPEKIRKIDRCVLSLLGSDN